MTAPAIALRGVFLWLWGAWMLALYYGIVAFALAWWQGYDVGPQVVYLIWTGAAFLPIEISGAAINARTPGDREVARTYSQWMQHFAHRTPGYLWYRGWNAFVTANALVVAWVVGLVFWALHPALGISMGVLTFGWNLYHWQQRGVYG